jgi:hypothetical protein
MVGGNREIPERNVVIDDFLNAVIKGDIAAVRSCLEAGAPVDLVDANGFMPLINAAIFGQVEVARILLAAGADPTFRARSHLFRGDKTTTALEQARGNEHKAVAELLLQAGAGGADPAQFAFTEVKSFPQSAQQPAFREVLDLLTSVCAHAPRPWKRRQGVFNVTIKRFDALEALCLTEPLPVSAKDRESLLDWLLTKVRERGFYLVHAAPSGPAATAKLRLFPSGEKYAVLAGSGTNGINYGHSTRDLITWLLELDRENPFVLTECCFDYLGGKFLQPAKNPGHWAEKMLEFCPDLGILPQALAKELEATQRFGFWWD